MICRAFDVASIGAPPSAMLNLTRWLGAMLGGIMPLLATFPTCHPLFACACAQPTMINAASTEPFCLEATTGGRFLAGILPAAERSVVSLPSQQKRRKQTVRKTRKTTTVRAKRRRFAKKRTAPNVSVRPGLIRGMTIVYDTLVVPGVIYRRVDVELADSTHALVHAVTCVVRNPRYGIELVQAHDRLGRLETLPALTRRLDSAQGKIVLAAINGSFWRAGTRQPLGISLSNGEIVAVTGAPWYALWLDRRWRPWLDTGGVVATVHLSDGSTYRIDAINASADGVQLFNRYAGDSIPVLPGQLPAELSTAQRLITSDTLDPQWTSDSLAAMLSTMQHQWQRDLQKPKVLLRYLRQPMVNQSTPCLVLRTLDSERVEVPLRGCVLTVPRGHPLEKAIESGKLKRGDTVILQVRTLRNDSIPFHTAISGTPLLVKNGTVKPQLEDTSRRGSPFVEQRLSRTAIGTDVIQSVLYLVTVEQSPGRSVGMSLRELAQFMKTFGASDALNLDGGGSATMVVGDRCVVPPGGPSQCRAVANALVIWRRKPLAR